MTEEPADTRSTTQPASAAVSPVQSARTAAWLTWVGFVVIAAVWVILMIGIYTTRQSLQSGESGSETQCYSLADKVVVNFSNANVASNMNSGDDAEFEKRRQGDYPGADIDNAFLRHNIALMQDRSCEAQRANDAAKLNLIGTVGATTLICWALIATRRRGIQTQSTT